MQETPMKRGFRRSLWPFSIQLVAIFSLLLDKPHHKPLDEPLGHLTGPRPTLPVFSTPPMGGVGRYTVLVNSFHDIVAAGLFAAAVGDERGLCQGRDVALEGLGGDAQFGIELGD